MTWKAAGDDTLPDVRMVWISSDIMESAFERYHSSLPIPAVPFDPELAKQISRKMGVRHLPSLYLVQLNGEYRSDRILMTQCEEDDLKAYDHITKFFLSLLMKAFETLSESMLLMMHNIIQ
jgi:hypothetical protein